MDLHKDADDVEEDDLPEEDADDVEDQGDEDEEVEPRTTPRGARPGRTIGNSPALHRLATGTTATAVKGVEWVLAANFDEEQKAKAEKAKGGDAKGKGKPKGEAAKGSVPAQRGAAKKPVAKKPAKPEADDPKDEEGKDEATKEGAPSRLKSAAGRITATVGLGATGWNFAHEAPWAVLPAATGVWLYLAWTNGEKVEARPKKTRDEEVVTVSQCSTCEPAAPVEPEPVAAVGAAAPQWTPEKVSEGFMRIVDDGLNGAGWFAHLGGPGHAIHLSVILDAMHAGGLTAWTYEELRRWFTVEGIKVRDQAWDSRRPKKERNKPGIHRDDISHLPRFAHHRAAPKRTSRVASGK